MKTDGIMKICCVLVLLITVAEVGQGASLTGIRVFNEKEQSRIVLDMANRPASWDILYGQNKTDLILDLPNTENKNKNSVDYNGDGGILRGIKVEKENDGTLRMVFSTKQTAQHNVFALDDPDRIVLDLFTNYEQKTVTNVNSHMTFTRWTKATDEGRLNLFIIEAWPQVTMDIRFSSFAQGEGLVYAALQTQALVALGGVYPQLPIVRTNGYWKGTFIANQAAVAYIPEVGYEIGRISVSNRIRIPGGTDLSLFGKNRQRRQDELIAYNDEYGNRTGTNLYGQEITLENNRVIEKNSGNSIIRKNQQVLSGHGKSALLLKKFNIGDTVSILPQVSPDLDNATVIYGGGIPILQDGFVLNVDTVINIKDKAPRAFIGTTAEHHLLIAVVDGRQAASVGMSLAEGAKLLGDLGAVDGMALQNNGCSELVVNHKLVNQPENGIMALFSSAIILN